jgi:anti-sigma B factor antagonist
MSSSEPQDPNAAAQGREPELRPRTGANLAIQQHLAGGRHTVLIAGELDMASAPELEALISQLASHPGEIVLDLKGLTFMDSTGVRLILRMLELCRENGCGFSLRSLTPQVRRLLDVAGVMEHLEEQGALSDED